MAFGVLLIDGEATGGIDSAAGQPV